MIRASCTHWRNVILRGYLKPGFHVIVRIVPIAPVVSKYFETIRTTGAIGSFQMIVSIASKERDAGSSAMSLGQTIEFLRVFCNKPHKWMIFILKANLVPWYLLFLLILRHWEARRVPRRHSISSKTWSHGLSPISNNPHTRCELFGFSAIRAEFILDYWNKSDDLWDSLRSSRSSQSAGSVSIWSLQNLHDRPYRPDRTQLYPSDRGRRSRPGRLRSSGQCFHMIVPIVWTFFETTGTIRTIIWKPNWHI